jgi:putative membrane protein
MKLAANVLIALVAIAHVGFLALEMFLWTTPYGQKSFNMTAEFAKSSAVLAANQGLYNGFLAAGLLWGLITKERAFAIKVFFLGCVIVAGVFGAATAKTDPVHPSPAGCGRTACADRCQSGLIALNVTDGRLTAERSPKACSRPLLASRSGKAVG